MEKFICKKQKYKKIVSLFLTICLMATMFYTPVMAAAPVIGDFDGTSIDYDEMSGTPVYVAPDITVTNNASSIVFEIDDATAYETLALETVLSADTTDGVVSYDGTYIYVGDGSSADIVGKIDEDNNGEDGAPLEIVFSKALTNSIFTEDFDDDGNLPGWTVYESIYDESDTDVTQYLTRSQGEEYDYVSDNDDGTYTMTVDGSAGYSYTSDRDYSDDSDNMYESELRETKSTFSPSVSVESDSDAIGGEALYLNTGNGNVYGTSRTAPYGSIFGPIVESDTFTAEEGDAISLDWKATGSGDDYEVYGFIVDEDDVHTIVFYGRGDSQSWTSSTGSVPSDGTYKFKFINGTYDYTGGLYVGASMYIDNIRVYGNVDYSADIIQQIARLTTYVSDDEDPDATRTLNLTLENADGDSSEASATINITDRFNHETELTTTPSNPTYFNLLKNEVTLFEDTTIDTIEESQLITEFTMTVDGIVDDGDENLNFDGKDIVISDGVSGTTTSSSISYDVTLTSSSAVVVFTSTGIEDNALATLIDGMTYDNIGSLPTESDRVFTLTEIVDDGGTANGGDDTTALSYASTVELTRYRIGDFTLDSYTANGSSSTADFTWTEPTGATSIDIYESTDEGSTWTVSSSTISSATDSSGTVTGLLTDTDYEFKLVVSGGLNAGDSNIEALYMDGTSPEVTSIVRANDADEETTSRSLAFEVTFDEETENVTTDDFSLYLTDNLVGYVSSITTSSSLTYEVVGTITSGVGSVRLVLDSGTDISDIYGNDDVDSYTSEEKYDIDYLYTLDEPVIDTPIEDDNIVNSIESTAVLISGTGETEADLYLTVTDSLSQTVNESTTTDSNGDWTFLGDEIDLSSLEDGEITISAYLIKSPMYASTTTSMAITLDTTGPIISGVTDGETYYEDVTITYNEGTATLNGESFTSGTTVSDIGSYEVIATDTLGNSSNVSFTIKDMEVPTIDEPIEDDNIINSEEIESVLLSGTGDGSYIYITVTDESSQTVSETTEIDSNGDWTLLGNKMDLSSLEDGEVTVSAYSESTSGTTSTTTSMAVTIDTIGPTVIGVTDEEVYDSNVTITFDEGTATLNGETFTSGTTIEDNGEYELVVTDTSGNSTVVEFTIDNPINSTYIYYGPSDSIYSVTQDIDLIVETISGYEVMWEVDEDSVEYVTTGAAISWTYDLTQSTMGADIILPIYEDVKVTLYATIDINGDEVVKEFELTLKHSGTDEDYVAYAIDNLAVGYATGDSEDYVTQDVTLDTSGSYGTTITWSSDNEDYITDDGEVTRPESVDGDTEVTLTATISNGDYSEEVEFVLTVIAEEEKSSTIEADNEEDLDDDEIDDVIETAEDDGEEGIIITIDEEVTEDNSIEVTLSQESVEDIIESGLSVTVEAENVSITVTLTEDVLDELEDAGTNSRLAIVCEELDLDDEEYSYLELEDDSAIEILQVYDFSLVVIEEDEDGEVLSETVIDFESEEDILLTIDVSGTVFNSSTPLTFYYNPDDSEWEYVRSEYDDSGEEIVIYTNHLSIYSTMDLTDGSIADYLIEEVINKTNPDPTLNEILNVIETEAMGLDLENYEELSTDEKSDVAQEILDERPDEGYTYDTFVDAFEEIVNEYFETADDDDDDDDDDSDSSSSDSTDEIAIIENNVTFADIDGHWAEEMIDALAARGIFEGDEDGNFNPYLGITRAEVATLLVRIAGYELVDTDSGFSDVSSYSWYSDYVATARTYGIVTGVSDTMYEPDRIVSRQEIVAMIMRMYFATEEGAIDSINMDNVEVFTDDEAIHDYAKDFIYIAKELEIVDGRLDNSFDPLTETQRGEAAKILYIFLELLGEL